MPERPAAPLLPREPPSLPLADEAHIAAWLDYEREARAIGGFEALRRRFVQLRFPIQAGISGHPAYRAATRRGAFSEADAFAPGLILADPAAVEVAVVSTIAGRVPVVTAGERADFVALVQAFTGRNEPVPVPSSVGACLVAGFNNWDRIGALHAARTTTHPGESAATAWAGVLARLKSQKALAQDRFVILGRGPYSDVAADLAGCDAETWLDRSLVIRREHECTHYFVYRITGVLPHSVLDELVADFVGLVRGCGAYSTRLALAFLGLEAYPPYRDQGRLAHYVSGAPGTPTFDQTAGLTVRAIDQLREVAVAFDEILHSLEGLTRLAFALSRLSLEECARPGLSGRLDVGRIRDRV